ncbi:MAG: hypothetical protein ACRDAM_05080, partial [Casimicrobium sp.]
SVPAQISLVDPDLALTNPAFVNVTLRNSLGDSETVRLDTQGGGRYTASNVTLSAQRGATGDGALNFASVGTVSAEYSDATTPSGGAQNVSQSCGQVTAGFTLATIALDFSSVNTGLPYAFSSAGQTVPCTIEVRDPDLTAASITVGITATRNTTNQTDTESFNLPRTSPGVYGISQCPVTGYVLSGGNATTTFYVPVPNNGAINLGGGVHTITVRYTDTTSPNGGAQTVTRNATATN